MQADCENIVICIAVVDKVINIELLNSYFFNLSVHVYN